MKTVAWARTSKSLAEEAPSVAEGSGDVLLSKKKKKKTHNLVHSRDTLSA